MPTIAVSLERIPPSEVIESLEEIFGNKVLGYTIRNGIGYFEVGDPDPETDPETDPGPYMYECNMCGKEASVNNDGYCSSCWMIWRS